MQAPELTITIDTAPSPDSAKSHHLPTRSEQKRQTISLARAIKEAITDSNLLGEPTSNQDEESSLEDEDD